MDNVSLIPHIGKQMVRIKGQPAREVDVALDQFQIMIGTVRVGYVGKAKGAPITFIRAYPQVVHDEVREHVVKLLGGDPTTSQPPPPSPGAEEAEDTDMETDELDLTEEPDDG